MSCLFWFVVVDGRPEPCQFAVHLDDTTLQHFRLGADASTSSDFDEPSSFRRLLPTTHHDSVSEAAVIPAFADGLHVTAEELQRLRVAAAWTASHARAAFASTSGHHSGQQAQQRRASSTTSSSRASSQSGSSGGGVRAVSGYGDAGGEWLTDSTPDQLVEILQQTGNLAKQAEILGRLKQLKGLDWDTGIDSDGTATVRSLLKEVGDSSRSFACFLLPFFPAHLPVLLLLLLQHVFSFYPQARHLS